MFDDFSIKISLENIVTQISMNFIIFFYAMYEIYFNWSEIHAESNPGDKLSNQKLDKRGMVTTRQK